VIARSSAFQFRGGENDLRTIGRQLNVTHVLEGSVERSGGRVKIVARLDRVSTSPRSGSNTYERQSSDSVFAAVDIAAGRGEAGPSVGVPVRPARRPGREARDAYMRGVYEMHFQSGVIRPCRGGPQTCDRSRSAICSGVRAFRGVE